MSNLFLILDYFQGKLIYSIISLNEDSSSYEVVEKSEINLSKLPILALKVKKYVNILKKQLINYNKLNVIIGPHFFSSKAISKKTTKIDEIIKNFYNTNSASDITIIDVLDNEETKTIITAPRDVFDENNMLFSSQNFQLYGGLCFQRIMKSIIKEDYLIILDIDIIYFCRLNELGEFSFKKIKHKMFDIFNVKKDCNFADSIQRVFLSDTKYVDIFKNIFAKTINSIGVSGDTFQLVSFFNKELFGILFSNFNTYFTQKYSQDILNEAFFMQMQEFKTIF